MNEEIDVIYNRYGKPVLRYLKAGRIVGFNGKSIGFVSGINLYNYKGKHVGWYEKGIMRDYNGNCVGFGENPSDTPKPFLPFKQFKPFPAFVELEPFKPFKQSSPFKPFKQYGWSDTEPNELFLKDE